MSQHNGIPVIFDGIYSADVLPAGYADLRDGVPPQPLAQEPAWEHTVEIAERDRPLLDRLEATGFTPNYRVTDGCSVTRWSCV